MQYRNYDDFVCTDKNILYAVLQIPQNLSKQERITEINNKFYFSCGLEYTIRPGSHLRQTFEMS